MRTRVPAWRAAAGEFDTTLSKVHICPIHFPGHAWIFAVLCVCCDLHKRNFSLNKSSKRTWWQVEVSFLWISSLGISSVKLSSLGIFTPLGSKEGLCMKHLLKNHKCRSMIWPWNFSWKFPKHRKKNSKPQNLPFESLCLWKVHQLAVSSLPVAAATVQCQPWDMSGDPKQQSPAGDHWPGSVMEQLLYCSLPQTIGKIIPDCTSLCRANSQGSFPVISPIVWQPA